MNSPFANPESPAPIHRIDPRSRMVIACLFILLVASTSNFIVIAAAAGFAAILLALAKPPLYQLAKRFALFNIFILAIIAVTPLSTPGPNTWSLGPLHYSRTGLYNAALIAARADTILLFITALLSTIEPIALAHTLHHFKLPSKLVSILIFNIRYFEILRDEYHRMIRAAKCRGFTPRTNCHTLRTTAHIISMLFIRSYLRAQRILDAMKCRGFHGHFHLINHFQWQRRDTIFTAITTSILIVIIAISAY